MDRHPQDIAEELARILNAEQRHLLIHLVRALVRDADDQGAGLGIWRIARAVQDRIRVADREEDL